MNKWIKIHITWEYWIVLVLMILSLLGSIILIINPSKAYIDKTSYIISYINTIVLVLLSLWLSFLKKKLKED